VLVGGFSPGQGVKYVKNGTIRGGFIWNPMVAGETIIRVSSMLVKGEAITDGLELPEIGKVHVDAEKRLILA
jgi:simple sugar transport system substrate-binding protein